MEGLKRVMKGGIRIADLTIQDFPDSMKTIAQFAGVDAALRIMDALGGTTVYIPHPQTVGRGARNENIRKEFTGYNRKALALKYGLSETQVFNILKSKND